MIKIETKTGNYTVTIISGDFYNSSDWEILHLDNNQFKTQPNKIIEGLDAAIKWCLEQDRKFVIYNRAVARRKLNEMGYPNMLDNNGHECLQARTMKTLVKKINNYDDVEKEISDYLKK